MTSPRPVLKKVLIIEDEAEMCFLLELLLNEKETTVEHVKTIAAARQFLQTEMQNANCVASHASASRNIAR